MPSGTQKSMYDFVAVAYNSRDVGARPHQGYLAAGRDKRVLWYQEEGASRATIEVDAEELAEATR